MSIVGATLAVALDTLAVALDTLAVALDTLAVALVAAGYFQGDRQGRPYNTSKGY